ncbi:hypothetical protein AAG906_004454 [Vitis piasezkii]
MELLSIQNYGSPLFDLVQLPSLEKPTGAPPAMPASPDVMNPPATLNSSSVSSASSHEQGSKAVEEQRRMRKRRSLRKNQKKWGFLLSGLKPFEEKFRKDTRIRRTTSQKRQRESRFAFMTKSEVDHLEDGLVVSANSNDSSFANGNLEEFSYVVPNIQAPWLLLQRAILLVLGLCFLNRRLNEA